MTTKYWEADFNKEAVEQRLTESRALYRAERRDFWLKEFPLLVVAALIAAFLFSWLAGYVLAMYGVHDPDLYLKVFALVLVPMVLAVQIMHPKAPTEESVAYGMLLNQIGAAAKRCVNR